jgi:hypothetical protein
LGYAPRFSGIFLARAESPFAGESTPAPSGVRRIPEAFPSEGATEINHSFASPETGDYLVRLDKADHAPSTQYTANSVIE